MGFPTGFDYVDEKDFVKRLLVPLLQRLGFHQVTNFHGGREYGKDLIFGEVDRFGQLIYHGLQAKYVANINQAASHTLVQDAVEAFTHSFRHPTKGTQEYISTFIAVNGGSISPNAREHFFESLRPKFGANVRLYDGNDVLTIHRTAAIRQEEVTRGLSGLLLELQNNRTRIILLSDVIQRRIEGANGPIPTDRLRDNCSCAYTQSPYLADDLDPLRLTEYSDSVRRINRFLDICESSGKSEPELRIYFDHALKAATTIVEMGDEISGVIRLVMKQSGPLVGA